MDCQGDEREIQQCKYQFIADGDSCDDVATLIGITCRKYFCSFCKFSSCWDSEWLAWNQFAYLEKESNHVLTNVEGHNQSNL